MDFNNFIAEYSEQYGLSEEDWGGLRKNVILSFAEDDSGKITAWHKGIPVFRHWDSEKTISPGDTWICSLDKSKGNYYFAKGLQRIDSSFMYELKRDQIEEIANAVWKEQRHIIEPLLEDKYKEMMNEQLTQAVNDIRAEYEKKIETMKDEMHQFEQRDTENKQIIASLQEQKNLANRPEKHKADKTASDPVSFDGMFGTNDISIRRDGPDRIYSQFFSKSRYFVHLSLDHRVMVVRPHESGTVVCVDNTIVLAGLSQISPFEGPCDMISEYSQQYGGLKIYL
ncbi:MAG: hypothetical protein LBU30_04260 [Candidatus Methanoplasma sp.]|jgi:phage regulator Rha-like protein|nr:hypothetical protein [Candidatus Methanoplasma sp.]